MIRRMGERGSSWSARLLTALAVLGIALAAYLAGVLTERMRFDSRRDEVLQRYNQALKQHQKQIMESEKATR